MTTGTVSSFEGVFWRPSAALRVARGPTQNHRLAATLLAVFCAFTLTLASAGPASAATASFPEIAVAAQTPPTASSVGPETPASPAFVGVQASGGYDSVLGCCVAPNSAVRGAADAVPDPVPVRRPSGAPNRDSPWYVSYRDADGNLQTVGNAGGRHAEVRIQEMAPGTQMSRPFGWRTVDGVEGPQWVPGTVCTGCQQYPPTLFPPGTEGAPGGPWGVVRP